MAPLVGQITLLPTCHQCGKMIMRPHSVQLGRAKLGWPTYCDRRCRRRFYYLRSTRQQREFRQHAHRDNYLRAFRLGASGANGVTPEKREDFMSDFVAALTGGSSSKQPYGAAIAWQRGLDVGRMVRYSGGLSK